MLRVCLGGIEVRLVFLFISSQRNLTLKVTYYACKPVFVFSPPVALNANVLSLATPLSLALSFFILQ